MKVVFLGTPDFAVPALRALHESEHEVVLVITRPSRPVGRRKVITPTAIQDAATELGLDCIQPRDVNSESALAIILATAPDVLATAAYGRLMKTDILNLAPHGVLNLHPSLLPRYRGASPIQAAIAAGETATGVTILLTEEGWDSGPIFATERIPIGPHERAPALSERLSGLGASLLVDTIDRIAAGEIEPVPQDEALATMTAPLERDDANIDWSAPAPAIYNRYRAFDPWPGVRTVAGGRLLKILNCRPSEIAIEAPPGTPAFIEGQVLVACVEGSLELLVVQPEGRTPMPIDEFVLGYAGLFGRRWGP